MKKALQLLTAEENMLSTDHWLLELVGFDTANEERLTTTQSFHKQIQRLFELG